ncbi:uncharacterized protein LOC113471241 [Diaphorina citri]|uniref:Uncharacterized protein LOC113471241 n=1 Tax=Diaphorina citri TaxID=121845 RepID=A0A3Q0JBZ7_DIACI|nr:uncharacterized protein LOC113471241 [Diaphorina citri]
MARTITGMTATVVTFCRLAIEKISADNNTSTRCQTTGDPEIKKPNGRKEVSIQRQVFVENVLLFDTVASVAVADPTILDVILLLHHRLINKLTAGVKPIVRGQRTVRPLVEITVLRDDFIIDAREAWRTISDRMID